MWTADKKTHLKVGFSVHHHSSNAIYEDTPTSGCLLPSAPLLVGFDFSWIQTAMANGDNGPNECPVNSKTAAGGSHANNKDEVPVTGYS